MAFLRSGGMLFDELIDLHDLDSTPCWQDSSKPTPETSPHGK